MIDPSCDPAAFTIQAAGVVNPRALCARFFAALCAATDKEPDWAERRLAGELGGEVPGRPICGVVNDDGGATDRRMRGKVRAR